MSILKDQVRQKAIDLLIPQLEGRRGSLLHIGAFLPELALHVMKNGLYVTVVEQDAQRMERFLEPLKEAGLDRSVTWDRRPYPDIEFVGSSYNYIVAWDGIPEGFEDPILFFKKIRRELKAGGHLFLRQPVSRGLAGTAPWLEEAWRKVPAKVREKMTALLAGHLPRPGGLTAAQVEAQAERFLNLEEVTPLSLVGARVATLPEGFRRPFAALPRQAFALISMLDSRLLATPAGKLLPTASLFRFARTKEFGRVFILNQQ